MTQAISIPPALASHIELWPLERLTLYERNPRSHSESQIEQIAASIGEFGFNNPIGINPAGGIIVGAARYLAARKRNLDRVPVIVLGHLSEAQQRAYRLADNQLALNASWDEAALGIELAALMAEAFEVDLLGFTEQELKRLLASPELRTSRTDEEAVPPCQPDAISQAGDLWALDEHLLFCGNAAKIESFGILLGDSRVSMIFTDPPYNVRYATSHKSTNGKRRISRPIANDDLGAGFGEFLAEACQNMLAASAGAVYVCMSSSELHTLQDAFRAAGGHFSTYIIWAKDQFTLGRSDYHRQYEPILYGWKEGAERFWCGDRKQGDVWFFPKPKINDLHPTMKPVALIERAIKNSSREGELVLDPFGGSGSTLIACQKTGRCGRLMEIDPIYVDVIIRRWQESTGRAAVLKGDGRSFSDVAEQRLSRKCLEHVAMNDEQRTIIASPQESATPQSAHWPHLHVDEAFALE